MQLPSEIPVMTLPNVILFPQTMFPLYIFEQRYRRMMQDVLANERMFSVAMQNPDRVRESPFRVAGLGLVRTSVKNQNGTFNLILQGLVRVKLAKVRQYRPYRIYGIQPLETRRADHKRLDHLIAELRERVERFLQEGWTLPQPLLKKMIGVSGVGDMSSLGNISTTQLLEYLCEIEDPEQLVDMVSSTLLSRPEDRQTILETLDLEARARRLIEFLDDENSHCADEER